MAVVGVISLGCDKNRVDTETILASFVGRGHTLTGDIEKAEIILVNTCAFIQSARAESIDAILEAAAYKQSGKCRCLVVAGCLPMKYLDRISADLPEVDVFCGVGEYGAIAQKAETALVKNSGVNGVEPDAGLLAETIQKSSIQKPPSESCFDDGAQRLLTTPAHYAYLKIADGCDNKCTYCTIPSIRGPYRSRPLQGLVKEADGLARRGVKELILVAQDTTRYGTDLTPNTSLVQLLDALTALDGIECVRLLYCYPEMIEDGLIERIASNVKIAKYIDIPLQHVDDTVLRRMNRRTNYASICALIQKLRAACPGIVIRTTFMVGFPGETEEAFDRLCAFLKKYRLDNVGFFAYSKEEDTPSARLDGHLSAAVKRIRLKAAQAVQRQIVEERLAGMVGQTVAARYEDVDYQKNFFVGRAASSAPDIDFKIFFTAQSVDVGRIYDIRITRAKGFDLYGECVDSDTTS